MPDFFGVDLPANLGQGDAAPPSESTPTPAPSPTVSAKTPGTETPEVKAEKPELPDLDKLERFRFEGREWTREALRRAYLRQQDYTAKTTELAETRKYVDNFAADLRTVIKTPALFADFQKIYPKEYIERASEILEALKGQKSETAPAETAKQPNPELEEIKGELQTLKQEREAQAVEQIQKWLDSTYAELSKKYPLADAEVITARAEAASRTGTKITQEALEKLFKHNHGETEAKWERHYKTKVSNQINAGKKAKDMGPGGGVPTEGPKQPRTLKEATTRMLEDLKSQGLAR